MSREVKEEEKAEQVRKEVDLGPVRGTSPLGPVCDSQANPFVKEGRTIGLLFGSVNKEVNRVWGQLEWAVQVIGRTRSRT